MKLRSSPAAAAAAIACISLAVGLGLGYAVGSRRTTGEKGAYSSSPEATARPPVTTAPAPTTGPAARPVVRPPDAPFARQVVIITIDGLRPDLIALAAT